MSKHTPGPWENPCGGQVTDADGRFVALAYFVSSVDTTLLPGESWLDMYARTEPLRKAALQERQANTRLIAAAPEMFEALKAVMDNESDWKTAQEFGGYVLDDDVREQVRAVIAKVEGRGRAGA